MKARQNNYLATGLNEENRVGKSAQQSTADILENGGMCERVTFNRRDNGIYRAKKFFPQS